MHNDGCRTAKTRIVSAFVPVCAYSEINPQVDTGIRIATGSSVMTHA